MRYLIPSLLLFTLLFSCRPEKTDVQLGIRRLDAATASATAKTAEDSIKPELAAGMTLHLWASDSLIADPVSIDIDDHGKLFYTRTLRQRNSEFDIRGHRDWEIRSIRLKDVEEKRAFLHSELSPENSKKNEWLADLNKDGSHDWRDMLIQKEQVYSVEDESGDGLADKSQVVIEDFNSEITDAMGGVLKYGDDLFVDIAPDLWRLRDTDGDGIMDEKKSLSHGYGIHIGFSGHGMSGVEVGPEGKIYWQIGDIGFNGKSADGQVWDHSNSGVIVRANPDGSDFEVFSYGNRNTHEFVFDEYGNLISEDNDGDHAGESERLVYVVNGADLGWRINWQFGKYRDPDNNRYKVWMDEKMHIPRWEGQAAYITPTLHNFVDGPTGMLYNPGTALSKKWKNTFFVAEFVGNPDQSGVHAFKLTPKGAGFELGEYQKVLGGVLATGIDFGPDGAMYVADWIKGWETKAYGRVWKLDASDGDAAERKSTQTLLADDFKKLGEQQLGEILKHADMRVRQKAQFELVTRGSDGLAVFEKTIRQTDHQLARVHAIWGISQFARKEMKHAALLTPLLKDTDPEIRAQAAKWIGDVRCNDAGSALLPLLRDENSRARFFAAEALGRIAYEAAIQPIVEMLRANNEEDVYLRHAGALALARIGKPLPVAALSKDASRAVRIAAVVALRRMRDTALTGFLGDEDEFIATEAARGINDDLSVPDALPALGDLLNSTAFTNEALIRRAIGANLRVGTDNAMKNLLAYASRNDRPAAMRAEAIAALSTWPKPSVLDRVDGRFRGEITRDPAPVRNAVTEPFIRLLSDPADGVRLASAKAAGKLHLEKASSALFTRLKSDPKPEVRTEALKSIALLDDQSIGNAIRQSLSDHEKSVRVAGLDLLPKLKISKEMMVSLLTEVIQTRTTEEKQAAISTLGTLPFPDTQKTLEQLVDKLAAGKLPVEVQLELGEAIDSTKNKPLIARLRQVSRKASPDSIKAAYAGSLLGGDADRGSRIFFNNQTANCIRCHSFDDLGGSAGPRLNGVASRLTRPQLLEALVDPSARIAPGFGSPTAPSSMPPMRYLLSKKEIRDVVEFLSTLKQTK